MSVASEPVSIEKRYVRPDGEVVWAFCRGIVVRDDDDEPSYIITHFVDFTARKLAERREADAELRFERAFSDAPIGMALVDLDGAFLKVNRSLQEITGYTEPELLALTLQEITHPEDLEADREQVAALLDGQTERYAVEQVYFAARGRLIWTKVARSLVRDSDGQPVHFIVHVEDISVRKRMEASLQRLADHDPLTDLWNRRRFEEELRRQVARCRRYGEKAALLLMDLDGFKAVNDSFGHKAGDDLLKLVAAALQQPPARHRCRGAAGRRRVRGPARQRLTRSGGRGGRAAARAGRRRDPRARRPSRLRDRERGRRVPRRADRRRAGRHGPGGRRHVRRQGRAARPRGRGLEPDRAG